MSVNEPRVAIVTGCSQGIGLAIAEAFLQDGWRVAFVSLGLDRIEPRFRADVSGGRAVMHELDVSDYSRIAPCIDSVLTAWGRVDALVNNAGIRTATPIAEITPEEWERLMAVNLGSTFFFSQAIIPCMKERRYGRIINMSSFGGQVGPTTSSAAYAASKAGQLALTKVFARELAPYGVTVNAIAPASVRTPEMDKMDPAAVAAMVETIPVGRAGEPEEVAQLALYLASEHTGFITGATFDINGGRLMR